MRTKINFKVGLDNDIESFVYNDEINSFKVSPNTSLRMIFGVNHKFINVKFGFSPKFLASDESSKKGSTKTFKLAFNIFIKNWMQVFEFSNISGYYIEDISDNILNIIENSDYILLPDMKTRTFRGVTSYKFNDKFSIKSVINQSEIQRKSAGSFIPGFTYDYFKMSGSSSVQKFESVNLILTAAYFYTFVIKKNWYFNLSAGPGMGVAFNNLLDDVDNNSNWTSAVIFDIKSHLGLGYNSESFFGGISYNGTATSQDKESVVKFGSTRGVFNIFIGYRFKSPKAVDRSFNWVEDKFHIK